MCKIDWKNAPVKLNTFVEDRGVLCPIEDESLPFTPRRIFYVCNVPQGQERGNHAHYFTEQVLVCIQGKIIAKLFDGYEQNDYALMPHEAIYVPKMIWDSQIFCTGNDVLLVMCSTNYSRLDYIEDIDLYKEIVNENN